MSLEALASNDKGRASLISAISGIFPADLGAADASEQAKENLKKKTAPASTPTVSVAVEPAVVKPPLAPAPFAETVSGAESVPAREVQAPELKETDALLSLLEKPAAVAVAVPEVSAPAATVIDDHADPDSPIDLPKTAKGVQEALIKTSRLLREKNRLIKELQAKGSLDVATTATEPLQRRIEELTKQNEVLTNATAAVRLENHPIIQKEFIQPINVAAKFLQDTAAANEGLNLQALYQATQQPDAGLRRQAVRAACADLYGADQVGVEQAVDAIYTLQDKFSQVKAHASQTTAALDRQAQEAQAQQMTQFRAASVKAHEQVFKQFQEDPLLSQFLSEDPKAKTQFDGLLEQAKAAELDPTWGTDHTKRASAIQKALAYDGTVGLYQKKLASLARAHKAALAELVKLRTPALSTQSRGAYIPPAKNEGPVDVATMVKGIFGGR